MRIGTAPTSRDFAHRAAARGLEPMIRWICEVESIDVRRDIGAIVVSLMLRNCRGGDFRGAMEGQIDECARIN